MIAITNEEKYLAKIAGEEITTPEPVLRKEQYLSAIANGGGTIPELPITREEQYLAILAGENYAIPTPETRIERYMAKACGLDIDTPTPITNVEYYWAIIAEGGSWPITTLTGPLPLTYESRTEHILKNYALYGSASGAGVETENLFDKDAKDTSNGYIEGFYFNSNGARVSNEQWCISEYISIDRNIDQGLYLYKVNETANQPSIIFYDTNKEAIDIQNYNGDASISVSIPNDAKYFRASVRLNIREQTVIKYGSTAPTTYIPFGYKIPLTNTGENSQSETCPIYIGSSKLGTEEYLDYESGKVYKRTANLWNPEMEVLGRSIIKSNGTPGGGYANYSVSDYIPLEAETAYIISAVTTIANASAYHAYYDSNKEVIDAIQIGSANQSKAFTTPANCAYMRFTFREETVPVNTIMLVQGDTLPETFTPYLQPTDPPVPFPPISTYQGENTLSSTETLGEVEITGRIKEAVPNG